MTKRLFKVTFISILFIFLCIYNLTYININASFLMARNSGNLTFESYTTSIPKNVNNGGPLETGFKPLILIYYNDGVYLIERGLIKYNYPLLLSIGNFSYYPKLNDTKKIDTFKHPDQKVYAVPFLLPQVCIAVYGGGHYYKYDRLTDDIVKYNNKRYFLVSGLDTSKNYDQLKTANKKIGNYKNTDIYSIKGYDSSEVIAYNLNTPFYTGFWFAVNEKYLTKYL